MLFEEKTKRNIPFSPPDISKAEIEEVEGKKNIFKPAYEIQEKFGRIAIVADVAHAFGVKWHSRMIGEVADCINSCLVGWITATENLCNKTARKGLARTLKGGRLQGNLVW